MNPAMETRSPVSTKTRVAIFSALDKGAGGMRERVIGAFRNPIMAGGGGMNVVPEDVNWSGFALELSWADSLVLVNPYLGPSLKRRMVSVQISGR